MLAHKKEILPFVTAWAELESIVQSEISQLEKDTYHPISLTCSIYRTKETNSGDRLMDTEHRLTAVRGEWGWGTGGKKGKGLSKNVCFIYIHVYVCIIYKHLCFIYIQNT